MTKPPTFADPANPTPEELTTWAYTRNAPAPFDQDWDIILTRPAFGPLFLSLAADRKCPNRRFFLGCLYLLAGTAVRSHFRTMPEAALTALTHQATSPANPWTTTWATRTRALLRSPESFTYTAWCTPQGLAARPT
ncbi:hypothetical protein CFP65_0936 [Kitasatospora sp. MMS16-BH015]|uniref:hypothetical protein n=1 Tax=Kitasatospora sp. MMS16-BH015 TaxID=2018025 RepID=UPI000CA235B0|nr:hypothetical protein [Kitasatospora sp. MMS16-BH015]AUG75857.1 hypothetical protein CFP65_0936 [Kitasatospora sp. MMS16-BH015]